MDPERVAEPPRTGGLLSALGRFLIAFFLSLPFPLTGLMSYMNPSGESAAPEPFPGILLLVLGWLICLVFYDRLLAISKRSHFSILCAILAFALIPGAAGLAVIIHRDIFSSIFMLVLAALGAFLSNRGLVKTLVQGPLKTFRFFTLAILIFVFVWVALQGYAIATRREPRWMECIAYNAYNLLLAFYLFMAANEVSMNPFRLLAVGAGGAAIDDRDISALFTERQLSILGLLIESGGKQDCMGLNASSGEAPCADCGARTKASACSRYRKTQEAISGLDKILKTLEIGGVYGPERKQDVLVEGWRLRVFDDVRVKAKGQAGASGRS